MEELSIGEVARRAGLRTSALRYYESRGLLPAPGTPRSALHLDLLQRFLCPRKRGLAPSYKYRFFWAEPELA